MAKFCSNCGSPVKDNDKYCTNCGAPVVAANAATDPAAVPVAPPSPGVPPEKEFTVQNESQATGDKAAQSSPGDYSSKDESINQKFFSFEGRLNRKRYLLRTLLVGFVVIFSIALIVGSAVSAIANNSGWPLSTAMTILLVVVIIFSSVVSWSLQVRRLHDLGYSGWWVVGIWFINAFVGMVVRQDVASLISLGIVLYLFCKKGVEGPNQYGPDPLAGE